MVLRVKGPEYTTLPKSNLENSQIITLRKHLRRSIVPFTRPWVILMCVRLTPKIWDHRQFEWAVVEWSQVIAVGGNSNPQEKEVESHKA